MKPGEEPNRFGKTSRLSLAAERRERTVLTEKSFTAPFKVMKPFPMKDGSLQVMVQTASAGLMSGDRQEIDISVGPGASLEIVSQSFEKIHKMDSGEARRRVGIEVGPRARLRFVPLPCIPFGGSSFAGELIANLADSSSRLIIRECLSCGRAASGERFAYRSYRSLISVRRSGKLIFRDNAVYEPELSGASFMEGPGLYEGFTHSGSLLLFGFSETSTQSVRDAIESAIQAGGKGNHVEFGVSATASGDIAVRMLGPSAERLMELMAAVSL
jgi:urease accessory protein